jgi:phytoene synthase
MVVHKRIDPASLSRAFELCDQITRQHSKSFYFSTAFLPKPKRRAIRAFYAFCRVTDNLADDPQVRNYDTLEQWRLAARRAPEVQTHPVLQAWTTVRDEYNVPQGFIEALIDGCATDLGLVRFQTWAELEHYCYCVASTVGLVSMHIIGVRRQSDAGRATECAIDLGIAMQLTNIIRDVGEDWRMGRIYLPAEDLAKFSYTEDDIRHHVIDNRFKALIRFEMDRADAYYDRALPGVALLQPDGRTSVGVAAMLYRSILGKVQLNDYDVYHRRAFLTLGEKVQRLPRFYLQVRRICASSQQSVVSSQ